MFIARQPIFNQKLKVYGYELLFRLDEKSENYDGVSSTGATATVISGLFECGVDCIVEDKYAFVNFDEKFIYSDSVELIGSDRLIIEMLEDINVDELLIERLRELKEKGYKIVLDDFVEDYKKYPLVPIANIIKYDLLLTPLNTIKAEVKTALSQNKILLAEKIETMDTFKEAKEMGFHLFQGFFFSKPSIKRKTYDRTVTKAQYFRILYELRKEEPSFTVLAEMIRRDVNLAYRLMRAINVRSGYNSVNSIKNALTFMGLKEIERWINILMLQDFGKSKPKELMRLSLIRTKFAEAISLHGEFHNLKHEASMMGLFSVMDAMLDQPMKEALEDTALPDSVLDALINNKGILSPIYDLFIAYEKGDFLQAKEISREIKVEESILYDEYLKSIQWARDVLRAID